MNLTIHRGSDEIGGTCIELSAKGTYILIDAGMPLHDRSGRPYGDFGPPRFATVQEGIRKEVLPEVGGLYKDSTPRFAGVLLSHYHLDHTGLLKWINPDIPIYCGDVCERVTRLLDQVDVSMNKAQKWQTTKPVTIIEKEKLFEIGPFKITPFLCDHSAFQAFAFLIECDGEKLFYSGDIRKHGPIGEKTFGIMRRKLPKDIACLMLEGTMLSRPPGATLVTEDDVYHEMSRHIRANKGKLVLCSLSVSNVTRVAQLFKAAKREGRILILDAFVAAILEVCGKYAGVPQRSWTDDIRILYLGGHAKLVGDAFGDWKLVKQLKCATNRIKLDEIAANPGRYVLPFREGLIERLEEQPIMLNGAAHIYSLWHGYRDQQKYKKVKNFISIHQIIDIPDVHVSGHAYVDDLKELVDIVKPQYIVPVHTKAPDRYKSIFAPFEVRKCANGKEYPVLSTASAVSPNNGGP